MTTQFNTLELILYSHLFVFAYTAVVYLLISFIIMDFISISWELIRIFEAFAIAFTIINVIKEKSSMNRYEPTS